MGDARPERSSGQTNAHIFVNMTNKKFIDWINGEMGVLSTEPYKTIKSEDMDSLKIDMWRLRLRSNPNYNKYYDEWFDGDKMPEIENLTPLMAKCWYCCDGSVGNHKNRIKIGVTHEERKDLYKKYLKNMGFEVRKSINQLEFNKEDSNEFLKWIGRPLPGFEHKWIKSDKENHWNQKAIDYDTNIESVKMNI